MVQVVVVVVVVKGEGVSLLLSPLSPLPPNNGPTNNYSNNSNSKWEEEKEKGW